MIELVEISKTNRAKCWGCGKIINKGEVRCGIRNIKFGSLGYYCYRCSPNSLATYIRIAEKDVENIKGIKDEFDKLMNTPEMKERILINNLN